MTSFDSSLNFCLWALGKRHEAYTTKENWRRRIKWNLFSFTLDKVEAVHLTTNWPGFKSLRLCFATVSFGPLLLFLYRGAGMAQWWEQSPPTNVAWVRFPHSASYVGWVCWFSTLHREVFSGYSGFPSPQKRLTWFALIVKFSLQCPQLMHQR